MQPDKYEYLFRASLNYGFGKDDFKVEQEESSILIKKGENYFKIEPARISYFNFGVNGENTIENENSIAILKQWKSWVQGILDKERLERK